jgi:hypothetical protein
LAAPRGERPCKPCEVVKQSGVYPASFVVIARTFPMVWATREPDAPSALVAIVDRVAPELFGDALPLVSPLSLGNLLGAGRLLVRRLA